MASRRSLKKDINYISDFTVGLCIMAGLEKKDKRETIDQLILQAHNCLLYTSPSPRDTR